MKTRTRRAVVALSALAVGAAALTTTGSALEPRVQTADGLLREMTLEEKVGQLFVTYAYGRTADTPDPANREEFGVDTPAQVVQEYHLGGIIHFTWSNSLYDPKQVAELSNGLQTAATSSGARVPLLISTDQEQGQVTRITEPATQLPGNMALGAGRSPQDAERAAAITGQELRAMGLNMNFAPSGDVNVNPANPVIGVRSFSSDPALAAQFTAAQVRGYEDAQAAGEGVSASVKHFPGHGDTNTDSHTALPVIEHDRQQWEQLDAPPFKEAIAASTDSVMSAHIVVPKLDDSGQPATLAPKVLTGMLRQELGYQGVVFTDSLQMEGVRQQHPDSEIPVLALQAGADVMLMPQDLQVAIDGVIAAVRDGRLTEQRIDESVSRVLKLKEGRGVLANPFVDVSKVGSIVGNQQHLADAQRITDRTTTLLRNDAALPLKSPGKVFVTGASEQGAKALSDSVRARGPQSSALTTGTKPTQEQIGQAVEQAKAHDVAVVLTSAAWNPDNAGQLDLVRALQATGKPVVAVAVRDPYDAAYVDVPAWIASYSDKPVAMESVAKVLFGETTPAGKLPVPVPEPGRPGTDRYPFGFGLAW
ncbi:glycoside hydrolase family 3 protein [Saccharopolyspora aridisoli]|uniref:beta-N-acetylhexosaminidase n=1 Tax=Saccharopolyspora aridisoli TaxID=2530385 RepID=A0A4R4UCB4_9PSEU|nr:glycoside hydrolase family 3 protein [Saccharopolyspora aridisoli]